MLMASKGDDQICLSFDSNLPRIPLYRFPIDYVYDPPTKFRNHVHLFTDRFLYRPGETMHIKGIWREILDTELRMPEAAAEVTLEIRDGAKDGGPDDLGPIDGPAGRIHAFSQAIADV